MEKIGVIKATNLDVTNNTTFCLFLRRLLIGLFSETFGVQLGPLFMFIVQFFLDFLKIFAIFFLIQAGASTL
jgi:hypothetical protein